MFELLASVWVLVNNIVRCVYGISTAFSKATCKITYIRVYSTRMNHTHRNYINIITNLVFRVYFSLCSFMKIHSNIGRPAILLSWHVLSYHKFASCWWRWRKQHRLPIVSHFLSSHLYTIALGQTINGFNEFKMQTNNKVKKKCRFHTSGMQHWK